MAQKLRLHSPVGGEALVLKWPVPTSEGKEGPEEIVDTIRLVCEDFPELSTPLATRILKDGHDVANYDYDETKALCERYNKAIDSLRQLVKGSPRLKQFSKKASRNQLKHILQQCYNHSVKDPEKLNHYEPFSPEVYGETSFELVEQMIKSVKFSDSDYFIDLGSGVGQVILQVSAATDCNFCYGIEKAEWPAEYAVGMEREFRKWMKWYGKEHGDFLIEKGDFLDNEVKEKLNKATIVFVNNFAFGPKVDHELKQRFANSLKEGARIVSSKAFCPLNFRITERNLSVVGSFERSVLLKTIDRMKKMRGYKPRTETICSKDIGTIMQVEELSPLCGAVSWTGKPFAYYVHTIDRTLLEKYFQRLRNPNKKDELEPRKDRKGRPVMSVKDKINGALSGGFSDSNVPISSSRWRRIRGLNENSRDSNSPLQLTSSAIKMLDFDSCSNSSQVSNSCSSVAGTVVGDAVVYGPTTRRQWNEYVKRPRSQSHSCTENEDSSNCDAGHDNTDGQFATLLQQKKKRMKTVKRLNNGVIGKRQLHQKKEDKKDTKESHSPPSKSKLRPRHSRRHVSSEMKPFKSGDTPVSVAASTTTTSTTTSSHQAKFSNAYTPATSQPPSLDSLNLLHAHTVMSTSGKDPIDSVHYNDRRMTETSNAYFKPTVQKQTVSQLEKHAGFLDMIENMKQRYLSFLTFMQSPQYRAMLKLQIEQEKAKNAELKSKTEILEKDISVLQKDGLGLIKDRLKEMGIKANTPSDLINQAKEIVMSHRALQAQAASLGAQINALQAEHNQKMSQYKKGVHKKLSIRNTKNGHVEVTQAKVLSDQQCDRQKRLLIANVDRLHAELHELQNVNRNYTQQPAPTVQPPDEINEPVEATNGKVAGAKSDLKHPILVDKSFILKEKLDMKENYDTFDEVLATLKQEISTISYKEPCHERLIHGQSQRLPVSRASNSLTNISGFTSAFQSSSLQSHSAISESKQSSTSQAITLGQSTNFTSYSGSSKELSVSNTIGEGNCSQTSVASSLPAAVVSSSWTTQPRSDGETAVNSPRILPPGMKIDIKKPYKIGANNIKSPPVVINKGKVSSGKPSGNTGFSLLHGLSNGFMQSNTKASIMGNSSIITSLSNSGKYTDNENTAAQNLISLKESLPYEVNSPSQATAQHQQTHQFKTKQPQQTTSKKKFNTLLINSLQPIPNCQNVTVFNKCDSEREHPVLTKSQGFEPPVGSAGQTTGLLTQLAIPSNQVCLNSTAADQNKELSSKSIIKGGSVIPVATKPRIVSSLRNSSNSSTSGIISSINNVNNVYHKHKPSDHSAATAGGPSPSKFRLLEPKQEGKQFSALVTPASHKSSSLLPLPQSAERDKTHSTVRQLLTTPALAKVQEGSRSVSDLGVAGTMSTNTDHIPYVTIQTPHHTIAANSHVINGSQASTFKLLQPQQQDLKSQQHVIISPKAATNLFMNRLGVGSIANNGCNSSGSRGTLISGLPSSIQGQTAIDSKGQAVKLIPSNGIDGKGFVECPHEGFSVVSLAQLAENDENSKESLHLTQVGTSKSVSDITPTESELNKEMIVEHDCDRLGYEQAVKRENTPKLLKLVDKPVHDDVELNHKKISKATPYCGKEDMKEAEVHSTKRHRSRKNEKQGKMYAEATCSKSFEDDSSLVSDCDGLKAAAKHETNRVKSKSMHPQKSFPGHFASLHVKKTNRRAHISSKESVSKASCKIEFEDTKSSDRKIKSLSSSLAVEENRPSVLEGRKNSKSEKDKRELNLSAKDEQAPCTFSSTEKKLLEETFNAPSKINCPSREPVLSNSSSLVAQNKKTKENTFQDTCLPLNKSLDINRCQHATVGKSEKKTTAVTEQETASSQTENKSSNKSLPKPSSGLSSSKAHKDGKDRKNKEYKKGASNLRDKVDKLSSTPGLRSSSDLTNKQQMHYEKKRNDEGPLQADSRFRNCKDSEISSRSRSSSYKANRSSPEKEETKRSKHRKTVPSQSKFFSKIKSDCRETSPGPPKLERVSTPPPMRKKMRRSSSPHEKELFSEKDQLLGPDSMFASVGEKNCKFYKDTKEYSAVTNYDKKSSKHKQDRASGSHQRKRRHELNLSSCFEKELRPKSSRHKLAEYQNEMTNSLNERGLPNDIQHCDKKQREMYPRVKPEHTINQEACNKDRIFKELITDEEIDSVEVKPTPMHNETNRHDLFQCGNSPLEILTPQSMSHSNFEEYESSVDLCQKSVANKHPPPLSSAAKEATDTSNKPESDFDSFTKKGCILGSADSFSLPPTPQKTPLPSSPISTLISSISSSCPATPTSPSSSSSLAKTYEQYCDKIDETDGPQDYSSTQDIDMIEKKKELIPVFDSWRKTSLGPETSLNPPCKTRLSAVKHCSNSKISSSTEEHKRPQRSSTSSRCSSDDDTSSSSTSSSSSFSDDSDRGGDKKKRRKIFRKKKSNQPPPKKLSTLHPPLSLNIGSPPKPAVQYSPMPSPGFYPNLTSGQIRLTMGTHSGLGSSLSGKPPNLTPLSVSVQHTPGYHTVSADSLRSPTGVLRSPLGGSANSTNTPLMNQYSTFPGPSSLSPSSTSLLPDIQKTNLPVKSLSPGELVPSVSGESHVWPPKTASFDVRVTKLEKAKSDKAMGNNLGYPVSVSGSKSIFNLKKYSDEEKESLIQVNSKLNSNAAKAESVQANTCQFRCRPENCSVSEAKSFWKSDLPKVCSSTKHEPAKLGNAKEIPENISGGEGHTTSFIDEQRVNQMKTMPPHKSFQNAPNLSDNGQSRQFHGQNSYKNSSHCAKQTKGSKSGGSGGPYLSSYQSQPQWSHHNHHQYPAGFSNHFHHQQHHSVFGGDIPRSRSSRYSCPTKLRHQSLSYHNSVDSSSQHLSQHRGPQFPSQFKSPSGRAAAMAGSPSLSSMDQPYGSDWWIVVMQNNQADSTMAQHIQSAEPNVLNSHPQ